MQQKDAAVLVALEQAQTFLDANAGVLQSVNATDTRKALDGVIAQLGTVSLAQSTNTRLGKGATAAKVSARLLLLEHHMRAIVEVAKAQLPMLPQLASLASAASGRVPDKVLLDAAGAMAQIAADHRDVFAAALGPDFLDQLEASTKEVKAAATSSETSRAQRTAATSAISVQVARGRKLLRVLDLLVKKALAGNAQLLADWQNRRRVAGPARAAGASAVMPATPATAAGPPAPSAAGTPPPVTRSAAAA
jgi:hypothetical protein